MKITTRKQAKTLNLNHYFTGKPCKSGHVSQRYTSTCRCCECIDQYYTDNKKHLNQYANQYRQDNKEYFKQYSKKWRKDNEKYLNQYQEDNKELFKQRFKNWREQNPDKVALNVERRSKYLKEHTPAWYSSEIVSIKQLYLKRDELNKKWNLNLQVDHIIPIISKTVCGLHCWANLQLLDESLNGSKHNTLQQDW